MSSENKKLSLKGSKVNIKIAPCLIAFAVMSVVAVTVRTIQMVKFIDPTTGFYTGGKIFSVILYAVIAVAVLYFGVASFFSADSKKIAIIGSRSKIAGIGALLFGITLIGDSFYSFFAGTYNSGAVTVGYTDVMKSGALPLALQSLFAIISALYLFVLSYDFFKGTYRAYKRKIIATAPVCWAGARLIYRFLRQISFIEVSDLFLELIMIGFMVMFFMALAQVSSGIYRDAVKWRIAGFGLSGAFVAAVISIPRLIINYVSPELIVKEHPLSYADLAFVVFIVTLILKIIDDARKPLASSAEYTQEIE